MPLEIDAKRAVNQHYGVRTTNGKFGGNTPDAVVKYWSQEFTFPTAAGKAAASIAGMGSEAWDISPLDFVFPVGTVFLTANIVTEIAFNTLTDIKVGTYKASDGTTGIDPDGLVTVTEGDDANLVVLGRIVGVGAQLGSGATLGATGFTSVIRTIYTGTIPTTGKARLLVSYLTPAA